LIQRNPYRCYARAGDICAGPVLVVAMEPGWLETRFKVWLDTQPECRKPDPVQNSREEPAK